MEFWSKCSRCRQPVEILERLEERALISLRFRGETYDAWLCDECAQEIINNPLCLFVDALEAVTLEKNLS